jgi:hypothetical protein
MLKCEEPDAGTRRIAADAPVFGSGAAQGMEPLAPADLCGTIRIVTIVRFRAKSQASNLSVTLQTQNEEARIMYNIERGKTGGVLLKCKRCAHTERVNEFDDRQGSCRTQAARAMQSHSREKHGVGSVLKPISANYGVMEQW